jgi:hypothetical protein
MHVKRIPLELLLAKVEWAEEQIGDLESALRRTFPRTRPYSIRFEDDPKTRERTYYVVSVPDIPLNITLRAGDILQNLRSALDHLACHLVAKTSGRSAVSTRTCFPIANDAAEYMSVFSRRKIEGMGQDAIDAIDAIKPYKGGNDALWRIHQLNSIDKHRLLLTACSTHAGYRATPGQRRRMQESFMASNPGKPASELREVFMSVAVTVPLNAGDKLITLPFSELEQNMKFLIEVAINEPQIIECKPIIPTLHGMSKVVKDIITGFNRVGLL